MTQTILKIALPLIAATAALGQQSLSSYYDFKTLDYPNSTYSFPLGINNRRVVVGTFGDFTGNNHGYVWNNGTFTQIDYPGTAPGPTGGTSAGGINDRGDIAGTFVDHSGFQHGYVLARPSWCPPADYDGDKDDTACKAVFKEIDFPGAAQTTGIPFELGPGLGTAGIGINNNGAVTGLYATHGLYSNGFLMSAQGAFTPIDNSAASHLPGDGTKCFTVGNTGAMACDYMTQANAVSPPITHGFLRDGSKDIPIMVAGTENGAFGTQVNGVNAFKVVVGTYLLPTNLLSSLLWVDGYFFTVNYPAAPYNELHSISDRGDLTGAYSTNPASHVLHGYIAFPKL